jgi:hypothetical protein
MYLIDYLCIFTSELKRRSSLIFKLLYHGKNYFFQKVLQVSMLFFLILTTNVFAQVGIGTVTPNASSVLDITSTTQGC